ncbi:MnmC family methyltransferase [Spirulina sp. CCNP1310]|uniref:tRNA (5-methylaminomethyl-2-thiouridine)(34)-methyltransferase MnmD n=1 Tax=Spirulina sp. CCNP1310 TaxID=3110249 RepID=UPI002B3952FE|nr:MnmC family methyltransferase [Spirulina sp. CCNP1310]
MGDWIPQTTGDGSITFFSAEFGETFHSQQGAAAEAEGKFIGPCGLRSTTQNRIRIFDLCYGLGYNSAAALAAIWAVNSDCHIELTAFDRDDGPAQAATAHLDPWPALIHPLLSRLSQDYQVETPKFTAQFHLGDARQTLPAVIRQGQQADAIFLDPFSPPKCPQLWTVEFLQFVAQGLAPMGTLATYSCAAAVRTALKLAGLAVGPSPSVGRKAPGTIARWPGQPLPPLSLQAQEHLATRAAVPYRDPQLQDPAPVILARRREEQAISPLEPSSHWKRRWLNSGAG